MDKEGERGAPHTQSVPMIPEPVKETDVPIAVSDRIYKVTFGGVFKGASGSLPLQNSYHLIGKGEVHVAIGRLRIVGKSHKSFQATTDFDLTLPMDQIANVLCQDKGVRFDIVTPGQPVRQVAVALSDAATAEELVATLPHIRTEAFVHAVAEQVDFQERLKAVSPHAYVTPVLVGINVAVFGAMALAGGGFLNMNPEVAIRWGSNFGPLTTDGQWWRLLTCVFLHFGVLHLLFNMWALYDVGRSAERLFGSAYYLALYLFSGLTGSLASLLWSPGVNSAGASGAIFGILGGTLAFVTRKDNRIPLVNLRRYRNSTLVFALYSLVYGVGHQGIDNAAHLGGLAGGFVIGLLLSRPMDPEKRAELATGLVFRATLVGVAVLALLAVPAFHPPQEVRREQEFRRDMMLCWRCDTKTSETFKVTLEEGKAGKITPAAFGDRIERELLPMWDDLESKLSKSPIEKASTLHDLQVAYLEYVQMTKRGVKLYADGIRNNSVAMVEQANEAFVARNATIAKIKKLSAAAR